MLLWQAEPNQQLRKKVADCIQSLGNQIVEIEEGQSPTNLQAVYRDADGLERYKKN